MSADNFAKMMLGTVASNNTSASAASAFEQKMRDAAASYNAMRQVEAELRGLAAEPSETKNVKLMSFLFSYGLAAKLKTS